jgi:mannosylglycerate hydrolase MGH1-like protein
VICAWQEALTRVKGEAVTQEEHRLEASHQRTMHWKRWGPYVSERAWGTVREDYSPHGQAWDYLPHDQARSKAYRWGEDGIAGICDRHQFICFALALWNGRDPILKERLFGLTGNEGNHGEDVKEYYFYLDSTPTHSYMKFLYKYPQAAYPYAALVEESRRRGRQALEYELLDTGVFDEDRYFDIFVEYAKGTPEDVLIRIQVINRGPETAALHLLPTIWFRNTWSWGHDARRPRARQGEALEQARVIDLEHYHYGQRQLCCEGTPELLFTENDSNNQCLYGTDNASPYVKDGINNYLVHGAHAAVNPERVGTKAAAHYALSLGPGESTTIRLRFTERELSHPRRHAFGTDFEQIFATRQREADEFYATVIPRELSSDAQNVMRQAFAGLLWSKQFYHYAVEPWLRGDAAAPPPPAQRWSGRNHGWMHLYNDDVISMPDKWEYPWYAAWDLAFHCIPLALVDADLAKQQLELMVREWYMHPNGQLPAYEWSFDDVNPPVHAWAAWRVYKIEQKRRGSGDRIFLEHIFHKLLLNFTWWVNRKDAEGRNIFQGGFLGLDNIGVFDRSAPLPTGGHIEQSDGTAWMGMYCLNMLAIAVELARENPAYENVASKFFEHFVYIAHAMDHRGDDGLELWDEEDGFFYDVLHLSTGDHLKMRLRSMVGLIPLFAVETLEPDIVDRLPGFKRRLQWFVDNRPDFREHIEMIEAPGGGMRRLLSIVNRQQLPRVLRSMLDEAEFLSPHGIRALSQHHRDQPYVLALDGMRYEVRYEPAESSTGLFGGNSNWRGPVWFPVNYLIIEALQKFHYFFGDDLKVECPSGSGQVMNLWDTASELSRRLTHIFLRDGDGRRPVYGGAEKFQGDPHWRDCVLFYEYFHGDTGAGIGASHQTGWTGLVAKLLQQSGE